MSDCMHAVILAAGRGSRMRRDSSAATLSPTQRAAATQGLKGMIPDSRGRPFLDHALASLADGGITDVCLVIGPDHDAVRDHYTLRPPARLRVAFAVQREATGTADALLAAEPWVAGRDALVLNADNLYPVEVIRGLCTLEGPGFAAFDREALIRHSNIDAARIGAFAIVTLRDDDTLAAIVEKPGVAPGQTLVSMNIWRFDARIFDACRDVRLSPRGEHELPLAVALAITRGVRLRALRVAQGVLDLSSQGDIAEVAQRLGDRELRL